MHAQPHDAKAEFEVASVKPAGPPIRVPTRGGGYSVTTGAGGGPGSKDPGHFTTASVSLFDLIQAAYRVQSFQITGPAWMKTELFDVAAKVPGCTTKAQLGIMLQNLLAERFLLVLHKEAKEMLGYELVVGKNGHKLDVAVDEAAPTAGEGPPDPRKLELNADGYLSVKPQPDTYSGGRSRGHVTNRMSSFTMEHLARLLSTRLGRPVSDHTGLTGKYDFELHYVETDADNEQGPTLIGAVQAQLGLKLEAKKVTSEILVVDSAEKVPTAN